MRILHTSDWHLGRSLHGVDLLSAHSLYADHLLEVVEREQVDVVLVSGDIYDRALPGVEAVELADEILTRLARSRAVCVISSGNHDSPTRLGFGSRLLDGLGLHVRTHPDSVATPVVVSDDHGDVEIHAIPFLDPVALQEPWGLATRSHEAALRAAVARVGAPTGRRRIVMAHAFVAGGEPSDSERDITVGGIERVPTGVFDQFSYAALGHLHGPRALAEHLRYSGSPIAFSFSEAAQVKGSWLIDLDASGVAGSEFVEAPVARPLARIRGPLDQLLSDETWAGAEAAYVEATLTDTVRPVAAMESLRRRFPHLLVLHHEPQGTVSSVLPVARRDARPDFELALDFVGEVRGEPASDNERTLIVDAFDACCSDDDVRAG